MRTGESSWREKAMQALHERRLSVRALAKQMGRPERTVRQWISGKARPIGESAIVEQVAAALNVPSAWLLDPSPSPTPAATASEAVPDELLRAVPAKFRRLAYALADPETADWLLAQLDLYERARRARGRASR